jgi:hypothetical protein
LATSYTSATSCSEWLLYADPMSLMDGAIRVTLCP